MQFQRDILDAIRRILRAIRESSRATEAELGISGAQLLVLQQLHSKSLLSISELAKKTQTHQSSVSVVVTKLAQAKLVKRTLSTEDARKTFVEITIKGSHLLSKRSVNLAQEKLFIALEQLPISKQKHLAELLTEVVKNSGFSENPASLFLED